MAVYLKIYLYTVLNLKVVLTNLFFNKLFLSCGNKSSALKMFSRIVNKMPLAVYQSWM